MWAKLGIGLLCTVVGSAYVWALVVDDTAHPVTPALAAIHEACTRFQNLEYYRSTLRYLDGDTTFEIVVADDKVAEKGVWQGRRWGTIYYEFTGYQLRDGIEHRVGYQYYRPGEDEGYKRREYRLDTGVDVFAINGKAICPYTTDVMQPELWNYRDGTRRHRFTVTERGIDTSGDFEGEGLVRRYDLRWFLEQSGGDWRSAEISLWINNMGWLVQYDRVMDDSERREKGMRPLHIRHVISHQGFPGKVELPENWTQGS